MNHYLVKYESDWWDEMNIYGLALSTEEDKIFFDNLTEDDFPLIHSVGFNQSIEYTKLNRFHSVIAGILFFLANMKH